jgi:hypothetical protein
MPRTELKLDYLLSETEAPSKEPIERACAILRGEGLNAY